jgi:hypothetical protein
MLNKLKEFLFILFIAVSTLAGHAQTFPVTIYSQFTYPTPIYLSNYANRTTINSPLKVQLMLNDLTISNRQVRLKLYLSGSSGSFMSKDFVIGAQPLYLQGGFPLQLTNLELGTYFEYRNLLGVNPNQYAQPLGEGTYDFCVEVYDFATNKKLSKRTCVSTVIFQNDPPILNLPVNQAKIIRQDIQNIIFNWTPRSINVSNVEYEFALVELWNPNIPYQTAFDYAPPLFTETTRMTTLQYDIMKPQLIPGKSYAWRVKAKALKGAEEIGLFKNNGFSEVFTFKYLSQCNAPMGISTEGVSQNQAKIKWTGIVANSFDYQVNYREKNANSKWYNLVTPREYATITNLKPNTTYEYTVGTACDRGEYTHSRIEEFTTLAKDEIAFAGCNLKPDPADLLNQTPLPALFTNDVVMAGDFPIVVLHATGGNGTFSGDGFVTFPFIEKFRKAIGGTIDANIDQNVGIRITFNNIGINTDFKLISGEIVASYDANWGSMVDAGGIIDAIDDFINRAEDLEKQKEAGTVTEENYNKEWKEIYEGLQEAHDQYKDLINNQDIPDDLKKKIADLDPVFEDLASNDFTTKGNTTKENLNKIKEIFNEVNKFVSEKCEAALKYISAFLATEKVNYLKLLASESGKTDSATSNNKTYTTSIYDEGNGDLKITHYKKWSVSNPVQNLFLVQTKDLELSKQGVKNFWLSYIPNSVDGSADTIDCKVYFKDPVPDEKESFCTVNTTVLKGVSAGAAFADAMGQMVFYGTIGGVSAEILGGIKAAQCGLGFSMDTGLQMGINAIVKTYLNEKFTTSQLLKEVSLPSATVSCATAALINDCGTKCAGISGFAVGFGEDVLNQLKTGKSLTDVEIGQSTLNGIKQGILNIIVTKAIGLGINKFVTWKGKYTAKQVEDALTDLEKNPEKYGVSGVESILEKYKVAIFDKIKIITKDETLPLKIKESFLDSYYYTAEVLENINVFRRFGGNENQAKLFGGFASTEAVLSRDELAILKKWSTMQFEAELVIEKGAKLNLGKIASQPGYKGGADQLLLPLGYQESWVKRVKDLKSGRIYTLEEFKKAFSDQLYNN